MVNVHLLIYLLHNGIKEYVNITASMQVFVQFIFSTNLSKTKTVAVKVEC